MYLFPVCLLYDTKLINFQYACYSKISFKLMLPLVCRPSCTWNGGQNYSIDQWEKKALQWIIDFERHEYEIFYSRKLTRVSFFLGISWVWCLWPEILISGNVKVYCRTRPLFEEEGSSVVEFPDDYTIRVNTGDDSLANPKKDYEFDRVYGPHVGQGKNRIPIVSPLWLFYASNLEIVNDFFPL